MAIRKRALRLLGSLVRPLKPQIVLAAVVLVISTALQVVGPILISIGLDRALPAVLNEVDWMPTFMVEAIRRGGVRPPDELNDYFTTQA